MILMGAGLSRDKKIEASTEAMRASQAVGSDDVLVQVNLRLRLDEVVEVEAMALRAQPSRAPSKKELQKLARRIYEARRSREKMLDGKLFGEPAWDMLLALFYMPAQGKFLSVSGLCFVSGVPPTTALRHQVVLTNEGLIERGPDELDQRRQFIRLTKKGRRLMADYLTRLFYADTNRAVPVKYTP